MERHTRKSIGIVFGVMAVGAVVWSCYGPADLALRCVQAAPVANAKFNEAVALYKKAQYQQAFNIFTALSAQSPNVGIYHYYLALCNQCMSRVPAAKAEYQWVVNNDPSLRNNAQAGLNTLDHVKNTSTIMAGSGSSSGSAAVAKSDTAGGSAKGAAKDKDAAKDDAKGNKVATNNGGRPLPPGKNGPPKIAYDFYTDWCNPCKAMEPEWEKVAAERKGIKFQRINAEDPANAELVRKYGVSAYPTVVMLDAGSTVLFNAPGAMTYGELSNLIDRLSEKY